MKAWSMFGPVLALALLFFPGPDVLPIGNALVESVAPQIRRLALEREILDPRECPHYLRQPEFMVSDLALLRRRARELADAPPLHDAMMLPQHWVIRENLAANRAHYHYLDLAAEESPLQEAWELRERMAEIDQLWQTWDMAGDAANESHYVPFRRQSLAKLRERLGWRDYHRCVLPAALPIWRFTRID